MNANYQHRVFMATEAQKTHRTCKKKNKQKYND